MEEKTAKNQKIVVFSIMTVMFLAAIENMITSTILPSLISSLGGLSLYPWVSAMFMLSSTITIPLYGKLSDIYGHKIFTLIAITIFIFGSILCGISQSMPQLIVSRTIQGIGAGGLITMSFILFGLIYSREKRAKMQGLLTSVWAIASIAGPILGALCVEYLDWRWAFFINIPVGIISFTLLAVYFQINHEKPLIHKIDYSGVLLFSTGIFVFLYSLLKFGQDGFSAKNIFVLVGGILLLFILAIHELRTEEPILPIKNFKNRVFSLSACLNFVAASALFSTINFLPLFIQGVLGESAGNSGKVLTALSFGWVTGSLLCGRLLNHVSFRKLISFATFIMIFGFFLFTKVNQDTSWLNLLILAYLPGLGMGILATGTLVTVQITADKKEIGAATSGIQLFRSIGGTMGITILGGIQISLLKSSLAEQVAKNPGSPLVKIAEKPHLILDPLTRELYASEVIREISGFLAFSVKQVFVIAFFISLFGFILARMLPDKKSINLAEK